MEKQKRWQLYVILAVIVLTIYNILPTLFYYSKPLKKPIEEKEAHQIAGQISGRVNQLEEDAIEWLRSFCKNLNIKPTSITLSQDNPRYITVDFKSPEQAALFKKTLPRAGTLIPFVPSQLQLVREETSSPTSATVERQIGVHFLQNNQNEYFHFSEKVDDQGQITQNYRDLIYDRVMPLALAAGGMSENARLLQRILASPNDPKSTAALLFLAKGIVDVENSFGDQSPVAKRFYASFTPSDSHQIELFIQRLQDAALALSAQQKDLSFEQAKLRSEGALLDPAKTQALETLANNQIAMEAASLIVKRNNAQFLSSLTPFTEPQVLSALQNSENKSLLQTLSLDGRNPFVKQLVIDWSNDQVLIDLYEDVQEARFKENPTELETLLSEKLNLRLIDEMARISRQTGETILPHSDEYAIQLNNLTNSTSFLTLNLGHMAAQLVQSLQYQLTQEWQPAHPDLTKNAFPILTHQEYQKLSPEQKKLALVVYAPSTENVPVTPGLRTSSIYVIAKGLNTIVQQYQNHPDSLQAKQFLADFTKLRDLLQQQGFFGYPATAYHLPEEFSQDFFFELDDFYSSLLKGTREAFTVHGSKRYAVLEFTDVEQRLLTLNKIEDGLHEDLLKWGDEYQAAQVNINLQARYDVPPPAKNILWDNFKLSFAKYFRGDDRKILRWGLDLSGGKTVRIGLRDQNNRPVTDPNDLREGVNELYKRVNKMGVSEVTIRTEGANILLDFPGSQGLSATELVKASSMTFHIVNEKFTPRNTSLADPVSQFLQEVWNEAIVTNRKDIQSIEQIAWQHLGGAEKQDQSRVFMSDAAKTLYDNGLRLANPFDSSMNSVFDDTMSSVAMFRGDDFAEWEGQSHPLLIVFHNYALAGNDLENVQAGYDPSKGNILTFGVKSAYKSHDGQKLNPRDDFYAWTSQFSQEKIVGTPKEAYSVGSGWRMAVILNGAVVSAPTLSNALREHAMISGHFSQREVNRLAADLRAGSLTFTPRILSEQNVSPELGAEERQKGILAAVAAALLVIVVMIAYYRFAGLVASVAVFFNLLLMWGVLQNLGAALTLPGIAGIILTLGMAVDANVLVYERFREEYLLTKRLPSAMQAAYRKAFTAIIDSNITTIIAAVILLQFDAGPIKAFAVMLIIGIVSSMFTALFMTRYFFAGWVQRPDRKGLSMASLFSRPNIDFLKRTKVAIVSSVLLILIGGAVLTVERNTIFGMDFTGGYALTVELEQKPTAENYRLQAARAFMNHGAQSADFQIRELNKPNHLRLQFGMGMEQAGKPFFQMPLSLDDKGVVYPYQNNPRINWVVASLADAGLPIKASTLPHLDKSWTGMSGQLSDAMRNSATIGLILAMVCILVYITFRFEFKYAISAILGLVHDVLITLGVLALLHLFRVPVQIDMQVIAALMTIIGYSLNDTIIIFDRIREDARILRKMPFRDIVNHALNTTLSRTMMTSGTTLLVLLALVIFGGPAIFAFALVMTIGVVVGTLSSLFVAAPLLLYFHNKELAAQENALKKA